MTSHKGHTKKKNLFIFNFTVENKTVITNHRLFWKMFPLPPPPLPRPLAATAKEEKKKRKKRYEIIMLWILIDMDRLTNNRLLNKEFLLAHVHDPKIQSNSCEWY